ncbi:hypothetical protein Taro_055008 [Colocasia esculenta]|uniref:Outer envelope pore protein 16-2, chloroplastic n=1 Tax=Colocasia esculenta TaxID=4460 RepID=A0A843XSA4_COLES|nr:hypothetical protein [Colocasia esculenta]
MAFATDVECRKTRTALLEEPPARPPTTPSELRFQFFPCLAVRRAEGEKKKTEEKMGSGSNLEHETRSLANELNTFDKGGLLDLGHPLLNRIADSFVKAAGIGAIQAVSREAYLTVVESKYHCAGVETADIAGGKKHRLPEFRGDNYQKSLEAMVKRTGKESLQWGFVAGVYSGLTYGLKEARGQHDWKNSAVAGAVAGAALALTSEDTSHEQLVQFAITGAALSTAANLFRGIF